jgi:hypothetical protein
LPPSQPDAERPRDRKSFGRHAKREQRREYIA